MDSASNMFMTLAGEDVTPRDALQNLISTHRSYVEGRYWDPTTKEQAALLYAGGEYLKFCAADLRRQMGRSYAPQQRQDAKVSHAAGDPTLLNEEFRNRTLPSRSKCSAASESFCDVEGMSYSDLTKDESTVFNGSRLRKNDPSVGTWEDGVREYKAAKAERDKYLACMPDESFQLSDMHTASDRAARSATTIEAPTIYGLPKGATSPSALASVAHQSSAASHKSSAPAASYDLPKMHATYTPGHDKGEFGGSPAW